MNIDQQLDEILGKLAYDVRNLNWYSNEQIREQIKEVVKVEYYNLGYEDGKKDERRELGFDE